MTDAEICDQILAAIDGHVVGEMLEKGETWVKKDHIIRIPHEQFNILRKYYEWTRVERNEDAGGPTEQEVDLPRYRVRNGGPRPFIEITKFEVAFNTKMFTSVMKKIMLPAISDMLNNSNVLLKKLGNK